MGRTPSPIRQTKHLFDDAMAESDIRAVVLRNNVTARRVSIKRRIAFGWYGGKYSHLDALLPLLPSAHHYCEPFGGSAAVLLNREPAPVETYNDLDGEVANFFRMLRDKKDALIEANG
jgi:DNA adenine methylase